MAVVNFFNYKEDAPAMLIPKTNKLSLVQDTYSNKFYGEDSYEDITGKMSQAKSYFEKIIKDSEKPRGGLPYNNVASPTIGAIGIPTIGAIGIPQVNPVEAARASLALLSKTTINADQYIQKPRIVESYNKYGDNWERYFEGNYKNPRMTEENAEASQQGSSITSSPLSITDASKTRKTVGTGIASTGSLNPYGTLDSGLNI